jgi:dCTP deaminase
MLDCKELANRIEKGAKGDPDGLAVIPYPALEALKDSGEASISLRLGRWIVALRQSSQTFFDVDADEKEAAAESRSAKKYYVPFGEEFILHPGRFVLASTLEWLKLPNSLAGYVAGKSTWARRGLIIETAAGVHPGFGGCITLELANVGEVPIKIRPGMSICQIFIHPVTNGTIATKSPLMGRRMPHLGAPKKDSILSALRHKET